MALNVTDATEGALRDLDAVSLLVEDPKAFLRWQNLVKQTGGRLLILQMF